MQRNWLIRTKNLHILGPISKKKVVELLEAGSIKGEDEICPGNGHWFFVKEKAYLEKFVFGDEVMGFNPITECESSVQTEPVTEQVEDDLTQVLSLEGLDSFEEESDILTSTDDHDEVILRQEETEATEEAEAEQVITSSVAPSKKSYLNDKTLLVLGIFFVFLALYAFASRQKILNLMLSTLSQVTISSAIAQTPLAGVEKKNSQMK